MFADEDETREPLQVRQRSFDEGDLRGPGADERAVSWPVCVSQLGSREAACHRVANPGHPQQSRRDQVPYCPTDPGMQCHTAGHQTALPQNPFTNGVTLALVGVEDVVLRVPLLRAARRTRGWTRCPRIRRNSHSRQYSASLWLRGLQTSQQLLRSERMLHSGHRALVVVIGTGSTAGALLFGMASTASAEPPPPAPPGCSAGDLAQVSGAVGTAMSGYLFSHPEVNDFFTSLRGLPNEELRADVQTYMDAHPQTQSEITGIRQPLTDLRTRCDAPAPVLGG